MYHNLFISFQFCFEIFPFGLKGFNSAICHHVRESQAPARNSVNAVRFLVIKFCFLFQSQELAEMFIANAFPKTSEASKSGQ